jgi:hypothetical protein
VVRFFLRGGPYGDRRRVVRRGLTLAQVTAHCSDPETSSSTCTGAAARRRTVKYGPWFDGYEERDR